ncbi:putative not2 family protein [Phaeomoniella chlamydospora]|uniref:Putative not2 family protein n=1 Tax=Phaeomoniella chlamydospora TaxID=158046 RepID=A0A0G2EWP1_PHACM|nr:putative not2 family protein [Phaeomoniella chlamydospora]
MNRGPGPAPLRGIPGFQTQQQSHARNAPVNTARVPNGKLGGGANWGFGLPQGGSTTGIQNVQSRSVTGTMGSFAQSLAGSQPATPLDPSEFPSLSGAPQSQTQNAGQAVWGNARLGQQFADGLDEFRHGAQGIGGQLSSGQQPQTGNIEEFPPLGRDAPSGLGGQSQERRSSLLQNSGAYGSIGSMGFSGLGQQQRNPLSNPQDRITSPASGALSSTRSPIPQGQNGTIGDKLNSIGNESGRRQDEFGTQDRGPTASREAHNAFSGSESPTIDPEDIPNYSQLSAQDKWGLPGLLAIIRHPSQDIAHLAIGHDLTGLGLDLNSQEPLHPNFATPFAPGTTARPVETDFTLPTCYSVANVQPLHERIPSFSEETLFYIFYTRPRDIMQELVADELMGRKWRYHKVERMWVTRDDTFPNPVEVEPRVSERGVYLWWDYEGWKRIRREYTLRYEDLDDRMSRQNFGQLAAMAQQMNATRT